MKSKTIKSIVFVLALACLDLGRTGFDWRDALARLTTTDESCVVPDWRDRPDPSSTTRAWCFVSNPSVRGAQQRLLADLFAELEGRRKATKVDYLTALEVGVRRTVAVIDDKRLLNPIVLRRSGDEQRCREGGVRKVRPRTVVLRTDDEFSSDKRTMELSGRWACSALMMLDELSAP